MNTEKDNTPAVTTKPADQIGQPIAASAEQEKANIVTRVLKVLTFPISAAAGFLVTHIEVRGHANKQAKQQRAADPIFDKIVQANDDAIAENTRRFDAKEVTLKEFRALERENRKTYRRDADARMKQLGRGNFLGKFDYISRSNKNQALIEGITVATIAIGVLLTIADSKTLNNMFQKDENEQKSR